MTFKLTVSNQLKTLPVSQNFMEKAGNKLIKSLVDNLRNKPAKHVEKALLREFGKRGILSLTLVSNYTIQKLNKEWLGKDKPTDVLSFPLMEEIPDKKIPFELGEIYISVKQAEKQAKMFGHSIERELAFLFVHGALHILGFDHQTKKQEKDMFGRQAEILDAAGFKR